MIIFLSINDLFIKKNMIFITKEDFLSQKKIFITKEDFYHKRRFLSQRNDSDHKNLSQRDEQIKEKYTFKCYSSSS
jgi:hypothetical protein